jgi:hypothetical protein
MARLVRVGEIEVPFDPDLEQRAYRVRIVASVVGLLLLLAALLGVLGGRGPLASNDVTTAAGDAQLSYHRFLRYSSSDELQVQFPRVEGDRASVAFSNDYLNAVEVHSTSVQPSSVTSLADRTVYTFDAQPGAEVTFSVEPQEIGHSEGILYGPGGSSASFGQWVYP